MFEIRKAQMEDLNLIMEIYKRARNFMAVHGNPNQWGKSKPPREQIERDIKMGKCHVCIEKAGDKENRIFGNKNNGTEKIAAVFYFSIEDDPTYKVIYEGKWLSSTPYGVVHRIASAGTVKGAGEFCLRWALKQSGNLRIDTHKDNIVMQTLLSKLGFSYCGIIHLEDGSPRLAYQKNNGKYKIRTNGF